MEYTVIGKSYPRHDAILQVTGRSVYGDDIVRPGMLHAKILRSAHAHARIKAIDFSLAATIPGVRAIVTAQDVPHKRYGFTHQDQPVLADDKVRSVSYTHLRAHETRHDLVCRLLLEKK